MTVCTRLAVALFLMIAAAAAAPALAQDADAAAPRLTVDFPEQAAIPGQGLTLRLTILVPTFMPKPPVWPGYEAPNLWTRVASTGPTSQRIDGATWAGITRRYLLSPMVPGAITLPAAEVVVTYADPDTNAPRRKSLATPPLRIVGTLPEGAENLDPFLAASDVTLEETVDGDPLSMTPGASVTRTVTATIHGTAAMFLPPLLAAPEINGLRVYPDQPVVEEKNERGKVSGTRTERQTLVAAGGGRGSVPAVTLDFFDLGSGTVKTVEVDGFDVVVTGPPAAGTTPRDWRALVLLGLGALIALTILAAALRRLRAPLGRFLAARRAARLASEGHAYAVLMRAVRERDHARLYPALDAWFAAVAGADPGRDPRLGAAVTALGAARYGARKGGEAAAWCALARTLPAVRRDGYTGHGDAASLPPLNPVP